MAAHRSTRARRFDDDAWQPDPVTHVPKPDRDPDEPSWSTYRDAARGPTPAPAWLVTDPRALDADLGVLKTGKEADVSLLRRALAEPEGHPPHECLLAVKRYRSAEHRMFHRDSGYLEGRRVRRSREMRAMQTRTAFGKELIAQQWAFAEFAVLARLWTAGVAVPYPVQLIGSELMMEFIGSPEGVGAPRLAQLHPTPAEGAALYGQMVRALIGLAEAGLAHGDLSAYNVLVHDGRVVLIDVPQAVDIVGNPQGFTYLRRDCENICAWFDGRGVPGVDAEALYDDLAHRAGAR
jgi:RIO kinase 1